MRRLGRRTPVVVLAAGAAALLRLGAVSASPATGVVASRTGDSVEPAFSAAFRAGAEEAGPAQGAQAKATVPAWDAARVALERGEDEYLKARLRSAEKLLASAVDGFLSGPATLESEPATRALILLAQIQVALGRGPLAEKTLERGLRSVPDFPVAFAAPPPEIVELLARVAARPGVSPSGVLEIQASVPGVSVRLAGRDLGAAPMRRTGLPDRALRLVLERGGEPAMHRVVDLGQSPVIAVWEDAESRRTALGRAAALGDEAALYQAGAELEAALLADESCVGLVEDGGHVLVLRFSGARRRILGGHRAALPDADAGWRALGRFCSGAAGGNLDAATAARRLQPAPTTVPDADEFTHREWLEIGLLGGGAVLAGIGGYFAYGAVQENDRYDGADSPDEAGRAADAAREQALRADLFFGAGALLMAGAAVLYFSGPAVAAETAPESRPALEPAVGPRP